MFFPGKGQNLDIKFIRVSNSGIGGGLNFRARRRSQFQGKEEVSISGLGGGLNFRARRKSQFQGKEEVSISGLG